jgi:2-oxo-3-hexenedioate decarboxylase
MSPPSIAPAELAVLLDRARRTALALDVPAGLEALSLEAAYDAQDALAALRTGAGDEVRGWKLGITSAVKQRVMGIGHPLFGRLFASSERANGESVAISTLISPRVEPELAIGLAAPIDASMDASALRDSIAWIAPALEITDSRYRAGKRSAVELVADNTSSGGFVIGTRHDPRGAPPIDGIATELLQNGTVVTSGGTADVLGSPINALLALARHLAARGLRSQAGEIVLSGAITDAVPVAGGEVLVARLAGLGEATVTFR